MSPWELKEPQCFHKIENDVLLLSSLFEKIKKYNKKKLNTSSTFVLAEEQAHHRRLPLPRECTAMTFSYKQALQYKTDHKSECRPISFYNLYTLTSSSSISVLEIRGLLFGRADANRTEPFRCLQHILIWRHLWMWSSLSQAHQGALQRGGTLQTNVRH